MDRLSDLGLQERAVFQASEHPVHPVLAGPSYHTATGTQIQPTGGLSELLCQCSLAALQGSCANWH